MLNIVFTGPATDAKGRPVLRAELTAACQKKGGMSVQGAVKPDTNILIASRTDTVKAKRAEGRGLAVLTYPQFITQFLKGVEVTPSLSEGDKVLLELAEKWESKISSQVLEEVDVL